MTATSNFLVPNGTFFFELAAFLVVLAVIARWVLPFLNEQLKRRQELIRSEIEAAEAARADAESADEERRRALEEARQRARAIVEQATRAAEQARADATAQGQEEHDRLLADATAAVGQARQRALEEATAQMGEMVMDVVERIIGREVDSEVHRDLVNEAITAVQGGDARTGGTGA